MFQEMSNFASDYEEAQMDIPAVCKAPPTLYRTEPGSGAAVALCSCQIHSAYA
jgi:hypothetical protein